MYIDNHLLYIYCIYVKPLKIKKFFWHHRHRDLSPQGPPPPAKCKQLSAWEWLSFRFMLPVLDHWLAWQYCHAEKVSCLAIIYWQYCHSVFIGNIAIQFLLAILPCDNIFMFLAFCKIHGAIKIGHIAILPWQFQSITVAPFIYTYIYS